MVLISFILDALFIHVMDPFKQQLRSIWNELYYKIQVNCVPKKTEIPFFQLQLNVCDTLVISTSS